MIGKDVAGESVSNARCATRSDIPETPELTEMAEGALTHLHASTAQELDLY